MSSFRKRGSIFSICLLCVFCCFAISSSTEAETSTGDSCSHIFIEKEETNYKICASISVVEPLDNVAYVAIYYLYLQPVNYEVKCFRLYFTEDEWIEIPFAQELQKEPVAPSVFAGLIPLRDDLLNGKLIPVISDGKETEELHSAEILLCDYQKK